jgi:hypothetical protein
MIGNTRTSADSGPRPSGASAIRIATGSMLVRQKLW